MTIRASSAACAILAVPLLLSCACGGDPAAGAKAAVLDAHDERRMPLGWLGARAHPLSSALVVHDEQGEERSPGGIVLAELDASGPLAAAGARAGDVLLRCGESWVPLKEDPTLDFVELVEREVSGGRTALELGAWRAGELVELRVPVDLPALEAGLPVEVERFRAGASAALDRLAALQREHGGFAAASPADELALDGLAALALRAEGAGDERARSDRREALDRLRGRIDELLAGGQASSAPLGLALALIELAEAVGPLPPQVLVSGRSPVHDLAGGFAQGMAIEGLPEGFAHGATFMTFSDEELPQELLEQLQSGEGEMQFLSVGGGGGHASAEGEPAGDWVLPEGASIRFEVPGDHGAPGHSGHVAGAEGLGPDLPTLLAEHDPERPAALERLDAVLAGLVALQAEDGGFGSADETQIDRLVQSSLAMLALGAAQRVGLELSDEPVERAAAFLRGLAHGGKVASAVARGADRRDESGRAACVAAAFLALGCPDTDPFARALLEYSDEMGRTCVHASAALPFHLLATAIVRRARGLPTWQRFYDEFRIPLVAAQDPDGGFDFATARGTSALEQRLAGPVFETAVGALVLALQEERLPVLLGLAENPFAPALDGEGRRGGSGEVERTEEHDAELSPAPAEVHSVEDPDEARRLLESFEGDRELDADTESGGAGQD